MILLTAAQNPYSLAALGTLLAALGLSATAGLRAYIPLLAVGLASTANILPLQDSFKDLASPAVLIILATLTVVEFIIDKVPLVDHVSDVIHTIIRPVSGAIIMTGTANSLSTLAPWVAAIMGALLALVFHGAKAAARPAVSATTIGAGNPIVSLVEDVVVIASVLLLLFAPVIGVILLVAVIVLFARVLRRIARRLSGKRANSESGATPAKARRGARVAPAPVAVVAAAVAPVPNGRGRRRFRRGGQPQPALPPGKAGMPQGQVVPSALPAAPIPAAPATMPPDPNAPTAPATFQPSYVPAAPPQSPIYGGQGHIIAPPGHTQAFPQQAPNQQQGNLYPPDAPTLPGSTP